MPWQRAVSEAAVPWQRASVEAVMPWQRAVAEAAVPWLQAVEVPLRTLFQSKVDVLLVRCLMKLP